MAGRESEAPGGASADEPADTSAKGGHLAPVTPLRPRSRQRGGLLAQWPLALVLLILLIAVAFVTLDQFRIGSVVLAAGVLTAFVLRLVMTTSQIGMLAVRNRTVDLIVLGSLGGALLVFALWVPPPS